MISVMKAIGRMSNSIVMSSRKAVAEKVVMVIIILYFLVLFMKIELIMAPTAPNKISPTAAREIIKSL